LSWFTDRNDLDGQLFQTFMGARSLLRETPQQAEDGEQLRALLAGRPAGGVIFTTVQKFAREQDEEHFPKLSDHRLARRGCDVFGSLPVSR
jgi:type I restriction enzyme R subunit